MTIYLDVVFFINLLYQFGILIILNKLSGIHTSVFRILIGAVCGSLGYCICLLFGLPLYLFPARVVSGMIIGILCLLIAFAPVRRDKMIPLIAAELLLSFLLGGILEVLPQKQKSIFGVVTGAGAITFLGLFCIKLRKSLLEKAKMERCIRKIRLVHRGKSVDATALIDTGNSLYDTFSKEPVIILDLETANKILGERRIDEQPGYRLIPYQSIGVKGGMLEAFRLDELLIKDKESADILVKKRVICAVYHGRYQSAKEYQVILHPKLL